MASAPPQISILIPKQKIILSIKRIIPLKPKAIITVIPTTVQNDLLSDSETTIFVKNDNGHAVAYAIGYIPNIDYDFEVAVTETTTDVYKACALPEEDIFVEPLYY